MTRISIENPVGSGRRQGWWKRVINVDTSKSNGYAFDGNFLGEGEHDLPVGSILINKSPTGSVKRGSNEGNCYRVGETDLEFIGSFDWHDHFLSFRDLVSDALASRRLRDSADSPDSAEKSTKDKLVTCLKNMTAIVSHWGQVSGLACINNTESIEFKQYIESIDLINHIESSVPVK